MEKEQEEEEYREHSGGVRREGVERTKKQQRWGEGKNWKEDLERKQKQNDNEYLQGLLLI